MEENRIVSEYREKFSPCLEKHIEFSEFLPGGNTKSLAYWKPFPVQIVSGDGCRVKTTCGNELLDTVCAYGTILHAHNDKFIMEAVEDRVKKGVLFGAPCQEQHELAKLLSERISGLEQCRFCNSGTEATMMALRTARAITKKEKIVMFEGGYHGTHDFVMTSAEQGKARADGVPSICAESVIKIRYNDTAAAIKSITSNASEIAAVIVEPFLGAGGIVRAKPEFLHALREVTKENNILFIFDEIFSLRAAYGGVQELFNITPDLTCVGKIAGGGYPIGIFGGLKKYMRYYDAHSFDTFLSHSGSFNGHILAMVAGKVAMERFPRSEVERLSEYGDKLGKRVREFIATLGYALQFNHIGPFFNVHFTNEDTTFSHEAVGTSCPELKQLFHLAMLNHGIFFMPRGMGILSLAMTESDMDMLCEAITASLIDIKPTVIEKYPEYLVPAEEQGRSSLPSTVANTPLTTPTSHFASPLEKTAPEKFSLDTEEAWLGFHWYGM